MEATAAPILREARSRSGMSQRALAASARTAQSVVARIELGSTSPTLDTLVRLVEAAGFDLDVRLLPRASVDFTVLDDVPRIRSLSPEDRLREVGNVNRFVTEARRA